MKVAVVIPCYEVADSILEVLAQVPTDSVHHIICVDDGCGQKTGEKILSNCKDTRISVIQHSKNLGVGAAVMTGYKRALELGADIAVKLDGDGQMNPKDIPTLVHPIIVGEADYTKGNRFYFLNHLRGMPTVRLIGNAALSFLTKFSTGYWRNFDPTNGFTAIHRNLLQELPFDKIHNRYFFESDMLYQLSILRAVVIDVPQRAIYGNETSHLKVTRSIPQFFWLHQRNFFRRLFYNYFLRDFHLASIEWLVGPLLILFGLTFGAYTWASNVSSQIETPVGTVMLATLPIIIGLQLLLSAIGFDIDHQPKQPVYPRLEHLRKSPAKMAFRNNCSDQKP